jgi:hypothetical protein
MMNQDERRGGEMIEEVTAGIWTVSTPLRVVGAEFGTRMTIVRVGENGLALFAPCPIGDALASEIDRLGKVDAIIAPNAFHHFYFADATKRYPDAARFLAEGVAEKLKDVPSGCRTLSAEADPLWKAELEQCVLLGAPMTNEVIFYHAGSRTLILTDLCFNFDPAPSGWTGLFLRLAGAHGKLAVSRLMRFGLKDREKVRGVIKRILEWDFERIIVTHGSIVQDDARRRFSAATAEL